MNGESPFRGSDKGTCVNKENMKKQTIMPVSVRINENKEQNEKYLERKSFIESLDRKHLDHDHRCELQKMSEKHYESGHCPKWAKVGMTHHLETAMDELTNLEEYAYTQDIKNLVWKHLAAVHLKIRALESKKRTRAARKLAKCQNHIRKNVSRNN